MKRILYTLVLFGLTFLPVFGQNLKLATTNAKVTFFFHGENVEGSVSGFEASISFDPKDPSGATFKGSVSVETLETGIKMRDKHLKSKDYFEADNYPKMTFKSKEISEEDNRIRVTGDLTIKGKTREETFILVLKEHQLVLTSTINTEDYDVMAKKDRAKTNVDITITIPVQ